MGEEMDPAPMSAEGDIKPYDIVIILGGLVTSNVEIEPIKYITSKCKEAEAAGLSVAMIGDGRSNIPKKDLQQLKDRISPSSSIHILGHGTVDDSGRHWIALYADNYIEDGQGYTGNSHPTANIFRDIRGLAKDGAIHCHLWSCFGGAAVKDIEALGAGSTLAAHSPSERESTLAAGYSSIVRMIEERVKMDRLYKDNPSQAMLDCFTGQITHCPETATFARVLENFSGTASYTVRNANEALINDHERYLREHILGPFGNFRAGLMSTPPQFYQAHTGGMASDINTFLPVLTEESTPEVRQERQQLILQRQRYDFLIATLSEDTQKIRTYIKAINAGALPGLDVNAAEEISGHSPILTAASKPHILPLFLSCNTINVHQRTSDGQSALHFGVKGNKKSIVTSLVKAGIDVNGADNAGETALLHACKNERLEYITALLSVDGIDVNKGDATGRTPLLDVCERGHSEIMALLLKAKDIDVNQPNNEGVTPLMAAFLPNTRCKDYRDLLINHGAQLPDRVGDIPLRTWVEGKINETQGAAQQRGYKNLLDYMDRGCPVTLQGAEVRLKKECKTGDVKWSPLFGNITGVRSIRRTLENAVKQRLGQSAESWQEKIITQDIDKTRAYFRG